MMSWSSTATLRALIISWPNAVRPSMATMFSALSPSMAASRFTVAIVPMPPSFVAVSAIVLSRPSGAARALHSIVFRSVSSAMMILALSTISPLSSQRRRSWCCEASISTVTTVCLVVISWLCSKTPRVLKLSSRNCAPSRG